MKFLSNFFLLALTASSCVAVKDARSSNNNIDSNNGPLEVQDRELRVRRKKSARTFRRKISPVGEPELEADENGNIKRRKSRLDLRELLLDDDDDDVDIQLMSDQKPVTLKMKRDDRNEDPFESWFGIDDKTGNQLTMVKTSTAFGQVVTTGTMVGKNGTVYQIRSIGDGEVVVEEVKTKNFNIEMDGPVTNVEGDDDVDPETIDGIDGLPGGGRRRGRRLRRLDSSSQIDILVLYTKGAMCQAAGLGAGGTCQATAANLAAIEGVITMAVAETNRAYELSGIPTKLRLVKTHYDATYDDYKNDWEATLSFIRNNNDGQLDYVHSMRDQFGADFVNMLVDTGSYCGIGFKPTTPTAGDAFSLTQWNCATGYYSFGHEIAHNMGCNHDLANAGETVGFTYGFKDPSSLFRTIMSYDCPTGCPRVQYFSSPKSLLNGRPVGTVKENNAQHIINNLSAYANFRQAVVGGITPVPATAKPVAAPTSAPTMVAAPTVAGTSTLMTTMAGGYIGAEGNMFDIKALTDITITNFAVASKAASIGQVEIWRKTTIGTCAGVSKIASQWTKIGTTVLFSTTPAGKPAILPAGSFPPVLIKAGTVQAFYVTYTKATNLNRYSLGGAVGTVQTQNADLQVIQGYAKAYNFGADFNPRAWNGVVYYSKGAAVQAAPKTTKRDKLSTTFSGGNGQAGNMVEVNVLKDIVVNSFDIHTYNTGSVRALVYYKEGSFIGFEHDKEAWTKIADTSVQGKGSPNRTPIPAKDCTPVTIRAGETYSFYITLTDSSMRYTNGKVLAGDDFMTFVRSTGNKYPFGASYTNRIWNGVINYTPYVDTSRELASSSSEEAVSDFESELSEVEAEIENAEIPEEDIGQFVIDP